MPICPSLPYDNMIKPYKIYFDQDLNSSITRQIIHVDPSFQIPFQVGYFSEIVPSDKIIEGNFKKLSYSAFNDAGLLKQTVNIDFKGHYYLEIRPKYYLADIMVDPSDVELNLLVNKTSFLYQLINHSETRKSISISGKLKKDETNMYSRVCENLDDLGWRKFFLEKMLIENRYLSEFDQYPKYMKANQVASLMQVSEKTIRNWTSSGKIPHKQINGAVRYIKTDIEKWIEQ
jgi:excisionase family DNA binding protein